MRYFNVFYTLRNRPHYGDRTHSVIARTRDEAEGYVKSLGSDIVILASEGAK